MKPHLSIITLGVTDFAKSKAFYEALGFASKGEEKGEYVMFETGGTRLSLFPVEELEKDATVQVTRGTAPITIAHNEPSKEDVDRVIEEARTAGVEIVKEPQDVFWGGYSGYFKDPDGYLWEIAWNPFTDMT